MVEKDPETGEVKALDAIVDFVAGIDMIDLVWLQGSIGETKRTFVREVVWKNPWSVQFGIDRDDSVAGGEVVHEKCQVCGYATNN